MSFTLRRNRLIALVAAIAMVVVICGYSSHDLERAAGQAGHSCHCDWTMHFTGVAGSAPHPVAVARPVLATWLRPPVATLAARSVRRLRAHLARGPPPPLAIG